MEENTPIYEEPQPPSSKKLSIWLIVALVLAGLCMALAILPICIIAILALLGPAVGNVFSNIVISI